MTSPDGHRRNLAQLKGDESKLRAEESKNAGDAAKKRNEAARKRATAQRASSASTRERYERAAAGLEEQAAKSAKKAAAVGRKVATNLDHQRQEQARLQRAESSAQQRKDQEAERQHRKDKERARELAQLARPTVRYIHEIRQVPAPQPEILRVAYMTANPRITDTDPDTGEFVATRIRVDKEIRDVREEVKRALLRDYIEIEHWPAAQAVDVLNILNDQAPHVVHFSGHGGARTLEFDDGAITDPDEHLVSLEQLARALGATERPPRVLVLNACDTLDGAEVLLPAVPVIIATSRNISDLAANLLAVTFYRAIASGRSVGHAVEQARYAIDVLAGGGSDVIQVLARDDVNLMELVLVRKSDVAEATGSSPVHGDRSRSSARQAG